MLFPGSLRRNVGGPIRLLCESDVIHGNNGDQESWAIKAVCRRLGYAGLKPASEKAVRSSRTVGMCWELVNREWEVWMPVRLLQSLSVAEWGFSFQDRRSLAIGTSKEDNLSTKCLRTCATVVPHFVWCHSCKRYVTIFATADKSHYSHSNTSTNVWPLAFCPQSTPTNSVHEYCSCKCKQNWTFD